MTDFLGTYFISKDLADQINDVYDEQKEEYAYDGKLGHNELDKTRKDSKDITVSSTYYDSPFGEYRDELQKCLESYMEDYPILKGIHRFNIVEDYNIQRYPIGGGFKKEHCERVGSFSPTVKRCLVFMTYLNDVEDGGTEFLYYNKIIKAEKGKTLIWPSDWTHTHRGQVSQTKEKTIVTGWYSYCWDVMG